MNTNYLNYRKLASTFFMLLGIAACGGGSSEGSGGGATTPAPATSQVSTLAGTVRGANGTGAMARFARPGSSVSDGTNLYVVDLRTIRKIVIATGVVTTLTGTGAAASFFEPSGITSDGSNLYVVDSGNNNIRKIVIATGVVTTLAGTGQRGAADGPGTQATFSSPSGITTDGSNLYVADYGNHKIRKIVIATGEVSSLTDAAASATFFGPFSITSDGSNLYVADANNSRIHKIVIATGVVSTLAGTGGWGVTDGPGATAEFFYPLGITSDGSNLYVADTYNNKIRKIVIATGEVSSLTGSTSTHETPGALDGAAASTTFNRPSGIASDGSNLYVADTDNGTIRKIALSSAQVSTLAGTLYATDGTGAAADFRGPDGIVSDGTNLYVADTYNGKIRKIAIATGVVTTLAGWNYPGAASGPGFTAEFYYPRGITSDGSNLYVVDGNTIRKIVIATSEVTTLAGTGGYGAADGPGNAATFNYPSGITSDGSNLYVTDTSNNKIRKIVIATGEVSSVTGTANSASTMGATDGAAAGATFSWPSGITSDGNNLYVADNNNNKIRKIVITTGEVSSVTGPANSAATAGALDGAAANAKFFYPHGITSDGTNLYVTDSINHKIRKIVIATGVVSSVTGPANSAATAGAADGANTAATFDTPFGIVSDGGILYVTDQNNTIRKIQ